MKVAEPLSRALNELKGSPRYKITKLLDLVEVYNKKATRNNFIHLFNSSKVLLNHRIKFKPESIVIDGQEYEGQFNTEQLIVLCNVHDITLYWDDEIMLTKIFTK